MITVKIQSSFSNQYELVLELDEKLTIKQLKKIISKNYPGYPPVRKQKIVYRTKVLQNENLLASLIDSVWIRLFLMRDLDDIFSLGRATGNL